MNPLLIRSVSQVSTASTPRQRTTTDQPAQTPLPQVISNERHSPLQRLRLLSSQLLLVCYATIVRP